MPARSAPFHTVPFVSHSRLTGRACASCVRMILQRNQCGLDYQNHPYWAHIPEAWRRNPHHILAASAERTVWLLAAADLSVIPRQADWLLIATYLLNSGNVIVNVTAPGNPLHPGYVARFVDGGQVHNFGEGLDWLQEKTSPFADSINGMWKSQPSSFLQKCGCD